MHIRGKVVYEVEKQRKLSEEQHLFCYAIKQKDGMRSCWALIDFKAFNPDDFGNHGAVEMESGYFKVHPDFDWEGYNDRHSRTRRKIQFNKDEQKKWVRVYDYTFIEHITNNEEAMNLLPRKEG